jgi:hypothetical protein
MLDMMYKTSISKRLLHFKEPAGTSRGVYTTHLSYYVSIEKDGVKGVGECSVLPDLSCDAMPQERYERVLGEACRWVEQAGGIPYQMLRPYPSILFGLETAFAQVDAGGSEGLFDTLLPGERKAFLSTDWCGWGLLKRCMPDWRETKGGLPLRETQDWGHRLESGGGAHEAYT